MHKINAIDYHNEPNISNVSISGIQNTLINNFSLEEGGVRTISGLVQKLDI